LDAVGNQTATTTDGTPTSKTQNSKNELTGVGSSTLVYDNNGNTTTDENGDTFTYDAWNRMVTDSAGTTDYSYDANSRRITQTASGTTTTFYISSQDQIIEERQGSVVTAQNVWSIDYVNDSLLRDDNSVSGNLGVSGSGLGERLYSQHDANFNVTTLTDAGGSVVERFVYTPYGQQNVLSAAWTTTSDAYDWSYYFQGMRLVPDSQGNLYLSESRIYDSGIGRWGSGDPKDYVDGPNRFLAFGDDPSTFTDYTGFNHGPIKPWQPPADWTAHPGSKGLRRVSPALAAGRRLLDLPATSTDLPDVRIICEDGKLKGIGIQLSLSKPRTFSVGGNTIKVSPETWVGIAVDDGAVAIGFGRSPIEIVTPSYIPGNVMLKSLFFDAKGNLVGSDITGSFILPDADAKSGFEREIENNGPRVAALVRNIENMFKMLNQHLNPCNGQLDQIEKKIEEIDKAITDFNAELDRFNNP
jgi:RHS repeat-associated protein